MDLAGESVMEISVLLISIIIGATVLVLYYINNSQKTHKTGKGKSKKDLHESVKEAETVTTVSSSKQSKKRQSANVGTRWRSEKAAFSHPWLLTNLKGHTGRVTDIDFSNNGKFLATCAEDRTVLLWCTKNLSQRDHKSIRVNIEFDHASFICWSPDSKGFIINRATDNCLEVYKVDKKKDGFVSSVTKATTFSKTHADDVIGVGIACNGRFIMTCSAGTDLQLFDLKGNLLTTIDTYLMSTVCAKISPCGRFIVATGFAPDVKVWEVIFDKAGEFQQVSRAFELSGHSSGVHDVAFDADTSHMATVSKGTWKVFNTKIEYAQGESPHLVASGTYESCSSPARVALSPSGEVIAVASGSSLSVYFVSTGKLDNIIENVYPSAISAIKFDSVGKYILTAGEKHIRIFHNITGYYATIISAKEKLRQLQTSAMRERLEKLIKDSEEFLAVTLKAH